MIEMVLANMRTLICRPQAIWVSDEGISWLEMRRSAEIPALHYELLRMLDLCTNQPAAAASWNLMCNKKKMSVDASSTTLLCKR